MFFGLVGFTATEVSFCEPVRPKNPAPAWFVHSWLTRTLVPEMSGQPLLPAGTGEGMLSGTEAPWVRRSGYRPWIPDGANLLARMWSLPVDRRVLPAATDKMAVVMTRATRNTRLMVASFGARG